MLVLSLVLVAALPGQRRSDGSVVVGELGQRLDQIATANSKYYWGTVLVATDGKPVLVRAFGAVDRSRPKPGKKPKPMSTKAVFDLGAASEMVMRVLVLRLAADRKLALDDRVSKHIKGWPADKGRMTVDHLLLHTSGLPKKTKWPKGSGGAPRPAIKVLAGAKLSGQPGMDYEYSQLNSFLLALVVEEGVGRFDKLLKDRVFKPFGMAGAGNCDARFSSKLVTYRKRPEDILPATSVVYNWRRRGNSGILASVYDVHALIDKIFAGKLLDQRERDLLFRPMIGGALKIFEANAGGERLLKVDGGATGYRTRWSMHEPSRSWIICCAANDTKIADLESPLLRELASVWAGGAMADAADVGSTPTPQPTTAPTRPPPVPTASADRFVGTFALPTGGVFRIERSGGGLVLRAEGAEASVRLMEGVWPGKLGALAQRSEDRGIALLERLVRGDATVVDEAFADSGKARDASTAMAGFVSTSGEFERIEFLGTSVPRRGVIESWYRLACTKGAATLQVRWQDDQRFASCEITTAAPPFAVPLTTGKADWANAKAMSGQMLRLTMEGRGERRTLVFEDRTSGDNGLLDCVQQAAAPR